MKILFSPQQTDFIVKELNIKVSPNKEIDLDVHTLNRIKDYCMDVEAAEAQEAEETGKDTTERGEIAAHLYDLIYNTKHAFINKQQ